MIIGINGKIGSGKDTVGKIIQYLKCYNVGDIRIEDVITNPEHEWWIEEQSNFEIKKFAGKLKQTASLLTGIPVEKFEDQEFKKTYLGEQWNSSYNIPFSGPDFVEHDGAMTVRTLLQRLGTEAMRDGLHTNVWVNALFADYKPQDAPYKYLGDLLEDKHHEVLNNPNWIITDMRFPNEMEAIVERKGITIRVVRDNGTRALSDMNNHPSETSLDDTEFDHEIINNGSIDDLIEKVKQILITEKII